MCMNSTLLQFMLVSVVLSFVTSVSPSWLSPLNIGIVGAKEMTSRAQCALSWRVVATNVVWTSYNQAANPHSTLSKFTPAQSTPWYAKEKFWHLITNPDSANPAFFVGRYPPSSLPSSSVRSKHHSGSSSSSQPSTGLAPRSPRWWSCP